MRAIREVWAVGSGRYLMRGCRALPVYGNISRGRAPLNYMISRRASPGVGAIGARCISRSAHNSALAARPPNDAYPIASAATLPCELSPRYCLRLNPFPHLSPFKYKHTRSGRLCQIVLVVVSLPVLQAYLGDDHLSNINVITIIQYFVGNL